MLATLPAQSELSLFKGRVASACHLGLKDTVAAWEAGGLGVVQRERFCDLSLHRGCPWVSQMTEVLSQELLRV